MQGRCCLRVRLQNLPQLQRALTLSKCSGLLEARDASALLMLPLHRAAAYA